jgi:serine/threonine-protein kinase RsbW
MRLAPPGETAIAVPVAWSRSFPADAAQAGEARRFLAAILDGSPAAGEAVLCLSELVTNAIVHSSSGRPGGAFTVAVQLSEGRLRVEVRDQGGPWSEREPGDGQHGRGLIIVSRLAGAWGRAGDGDAGWTVWFAMKCACLGGATPPHPASVAWMNL